MQSRHAVYTEAVMNINVSHVNRVISVNDGNALILKFSSYFVIQHLDNRHKLGNNFLQIIYRPFLQSLCQNGMIRICAGSGYNINGIIHIQAPLCQQADQLRNYHCRMSIIDLNHCVIRQVIKAAAFGRTLIQNKLSAAAYHKVLLIDPEQSALLIAVVRIKEQCQILFNIFFIEFNSVFYDCIIHRIQIKQMELVGLVVVACNLNIIHSCIDFQPFKLNRICNIRLFQPGSLFNPWIRRLFLQIVLKYLFKQSQMIVQTDSVAGQSQCSDRIKETCSQTSQSSVSKRRLRLDSLNFTDILSVLLQDILYFSVNSEIDHIIGKKLSNKKFCRDIINFFLAVCAFLLSRHLLNNIQKSVINFLIFCL